VHWIDLILFFLHDAGDRLINLLIMGWELEDCLAMDLLLALILIIFSSYYTIKPRYVKDEADAFGKKRSFSSFIALSIFIETLLIKTAHSFYQPRLVVLDI
jgi:ABC-type iron transport system FetAB permease component